MQEILNSDQRLVILRSLVECGDSANESILQTCLQTYGHRVSRDTVRTLLAWLREQGLVTLSDNAPGVTSPASQDAVKMWPSGWRQSPASKPRARE